MIRLAAACGYLGQSYYGHVDPMMPASTCPGRSMERLDIADDQKRRFVQELLPRLISMMSTISSADDEQIAIEGIVGVVLFGWPLGFISRKMVDGLRLDAGGFVIRSAGTASGRAKVEAGRPWPQEFRGSNRRSSSCRRPAAGDPRAPSPSEPDGSSSSGLRSVVGHALSMDGKGLLFVDQWKESMPTMWSS